MKPVARVVTSVLLLALCDGVSAYLEPTHQIMSEAALQASVLGAPPDASTRDRRERLGWPAVGDESYKRANSKGDARTLLQLVLDGAEFEDVDERGLNHFFDPRTGFGMRVFPERFLEPPPQWLRTMVMDLGSASPDWALGTYALVHYPMPQEYSYKDLKTYYFDALTNRDPASRARATGKAFQTLGHLIHHIQDMAQPQHARNDAHVSDEKITAECLQQQPRPTTMKCGLYWWLYNKSFYESWVHTLTKAGVNLPLSGYAPVYGPTSDGLNVFNAPRLFWTDSLGRGMADFTSRNFLSDQTMDENPPALGPSFDMLVGDLCTAAVPACGPLDMTKKVTFWPSQVDDKFRPTGSMPHPYAASWSIFTPDLAWWAPNGPATPKTINRYTIQYDLAYLIPRAVGYSAGFINYFFRGDMEVALPDEKVFAVVDTSAQACGNPCGFRTAKLKVRNTTPTDFMGSGYLYLVARYRLNTCYLANLAGEDGTQVFADGNGTSNKCRSQQEYVAVSDSASVKFVDRNFGLPTKFTFPDNAPIPLAATDLSLQVVFRGKLGQEDDAIAVSTLNVAEPNYIAVGNITDYVFDDAFQRYFPVPYKWNPADVPLTSVQFALSDPATGPFLATLSNLRGGEHAQLAFITDRSSPRLWLHTTSSEAYPHHDNVPWMLEEFFYDESVTPAVYGRTCPVMKIRGQWRQMAFHYVQLAHGFAAQSPSGGDRALLSTHDAAASRGVQPKYNANCGSTVPDGSGGLYDLSVLLPLYSPSNQKAWGIQF